LLPDTYAENEFFITVFLGTDQFKNRHSQCTLYNVQLAIIYSMLLMV